MPAERDSVLYMEPDLRGMDGTIPAEEDSLSEEDSLHFPIYDLREVESKLLPRNVTMKNLLYMSYSTVNQLYTSKIA